MIRREDVADLRAGDVVEITRNEWPAGSAVRGPLTATDGLGHALYILDGFFGVRGLDGEPYDPSGTLTVVSRAPRPLYVNHDRSEPVPGDVVRDADGNLPATWHFDADGDWLNNASTTRTRTQLPDRLRLLVDGETGQVVQ